MPGQQLLDGPRSARGKGRNDCPVQHLFSVVVLTVALRHQSFESCLAELHREPSLCRLILVGVKHEVPLAYRVSDTKAGDNGRVRPPVEQARANLPEGRTLTLAYDKAADDEKVHACLHEHGIKPLLRNRALREEEPERPLPGPKGRYPLNVVHDEAGTVYCYDQSGTAPVRHRMAYVGYEKDRRTLKYRCPARHEGWRCGNDERCNQGKSYGLIVRADRTPDLRRFPPIPRATKQFEERYKGRTAAERVNARAKIFRGVDDGNVAGARRFHAYVGVVMVACVAFATPLGKTARREGSMGDTRLSPIALALEEALAKEAPGGMPRQTDPCEATAIGIGTEPEEVNTT